MTLTASHVVKAAIALLNSPLARLPPEEGQKLWRIICAAARRGEVEASWFVYLAYFDILQQTKH